MLLSMGKNKMNCGGAAENLDGKLIQNALTLKMQINYLGQTDEISRKKSPFCLGRDISPILHHVIIEPVSIYALLKIIQFIFPL